jgi:hypothetical protein
VTTGTGFPAVRTRELEIRWAAPVRTMRRVDVPTERDVRVAGEATDPGAGLAAPAGAPPAPWRALEPAGECAFGMARAGNRATGTDSSGIATVLAGGLTIARTDAVIRVAYGSESAIRPSTPNQNRWRRVPNPRRPPPPA